MNLHIINPEQINLIDQLGIQQKRADEIAKELDRLLMMRRTVKPESVGKLFQDIASFCRDQEEYTFALVSHCGYMATVHKYIYCAPVAHFKNSN